MRWLETIEIHGSDRYGYGVHIKIKILTQNMDAWIAASNNWWLQKKLGFYTTKILNIYYSETDNYDYNQPTTK